jgi:hypothetical protein
MKIRHRTNGNDWPEDCHSGVEQVIARFKRDFPGWWYSLGECQVSCDASCAPTKLSPDIELIEYDERFNSGFHVDLLQKSTLSEALEAAMEEAAEARTIALEKKNKGA